MNAADLDEYLERTVRFDGLAIPPEACRDDGPTLAVPPPALAALAAKSALTTRRRAAYSGYPPAEAQLFSGRRLRRAVAAPADTTGGEMRLAVIGIWMVAAFLFATLGILVK